MILKPMTPKKMIHRKMTLRRMIFSKEDTSKGDVKKDDSNLTDKKKDSTVTEKIQIRKTHRHLIKKMIRIPQIQEVDQIL